MFVIENGAPLVNGQGGDELVENFHRSPMARTSQWLHFRRGCGKVFFGRESFEVLTGISDLPFDRG